MYLFAGNLLYDSKATDKTLTKRLAMNILVEKYKSPNARYFRAAQTFLKCAEQVILKLLQDEIRVLHFISMFLIYFISNVFLIFL